MRTPEEIAIDIIYNSVAEHASAGIAKVGEGSPLYNLLVSKVAQAIANERATHHHAGVSEKVAGETSDGYHTFNELYDHRVLLYINLCLVFPEQCYWKNDFEGWFLLVWQSPVGQISYHCPEKYLELIKTKIRENPDNHVWDGHKSADVINRLLAYSQRSQQPAQVVKLPKKMLPSVTSYRGGHNDCLKTIRALNQGTVFEEDV